MHVIGFAEVLLTVTQAPLPFPLGHAPNIESSKLQILWHSDVVTGLNLMHCKTNQRFEPDAGMPGDEAVALKDEMFRPCVLDLPQAIHKSRRLIAPGKNNNNQKHMR